MNEITSCAEALRLLAAHLDGELDDAQHSDVEQHLHTCRSCYSRAEFESRLKVSMASLRSEPVPPELVARVNSVIEQFSTETGR